MCNSKFTVVLMFKFNNILFSIDMKVFYASAVPVGDIFSKLPGWPGIRRVDLSLV